ncbi:hypothetical protein DQ238_14195 [Geodermatophilus sp. TF02-6]|uniref:hypothetical protein n=1 Tax=Geodermatophilus sp. TF02-6 TaxID=2250575 RepID=UPI000DEBE8B6|nr:hypothetical protein [Geodermatophilus sp. TF02-6]RBY77809.1 hypothetical protein DQ238_14195 [Geodermatophilus sp. TF02-6]
MQTSDVGAAPAPASASGHRHDGRPDLLIACGAAVVAAACFLVVRRSLIDDTYITLSYARNLAEHLHWGLTPFRTANSATSPLNVLVLGAAAFVVRDPVWGLGVTFVLLSATQTWGLCRLAGLLRLPRAAAVGAAALLLLSPLMLSIVGMEMTLALTLLVWAVVATVEGRPVSFGVLTAALVLTRMDLLVFPLALWLGSRELRRRTVPVVATAVVVALPWYVFSWLALGALIPDTLVLKTSATFAWGPWHFASGWRLYLERFPVATLLSAVPALVGLAALVAWFAGRAWRVPRFAGLGPVATVGVGGVAHAVAYSVLAPPPFHWYYAPSVGALTIVAALATGAVAVDRGAGAAGAGVRSRWRPRVVVPLGLAGLLLATDVAFVVQRGLPWEMPPVTTNWATAVDYLRIGEDLQTRLGDEVVRSPGEIGTIAYACRCDIVDAFSDRGTLVPEIDRREAEAGTLMRWLLRLNFANLDRPPAAVPDVALVYTPGASGGEWPVHSVWLGEGSFSLTRP